MDVAVSAPQSGNSCAPYMSGNRTMRPKDCGNPYSAVRRNAMRIHARRSARGATDCTHYSCTISLPEWRGIRVELCERAEKSRRSEGASSGRREDSNPRQSAWKDSSARAFQVKLTATRVSTIRAGTATVSAYSRPGRRHTRPRSRRTRPGSPRGVARLRARQSKRHRRVA